MDDAQRLEKIARMDLYDVPHGQIAHAVGLSEGRITQIMESDKYKNIIENLTSEHFEKNRTLNEGWDSIEATAMNNVITHLNWTKDADYSLKAAALANRAARRGQNNNRPLDGRAGVRAVIHLTAQFVDKLQVNKTTVNNAGPALALQDRSARGNPILKDSDSMSPEQVEKVFATKDNGEEEEKGNDILSFIPNMALGQ